MELYYVFIISAIFSWAISAPLIQKGMSAADTRFKIVTALLVSFGVGYFFLFFSTGKIGTIPPEQAVFSFLAGLLTFPVGTGIYYFTIGKISAKNMMPFLYLKIPFILFLSYAILGEAFVFSLNVLLGMLLLVTGLVVVSLSMSRKRLGKSKGSMMATILLAASIPLAWAFGEIAIKLGTSGIAPVRGVMYSLGFGFYTMLGLVLLYSIFMKRRWTRKDYMPRKTYLYFAGHGFFSIFIAYSLYFWAIGLGSVAFTSLLVAVWPLLAVFLGIIAERFQKIPFTGNLYMLIGGSLLCFVSEILILLA
jgi:drug/metabolite transporter (DMT)-like permease